MPIRLQANALGREGGEPARGGSAVPTPFVVGGKDEGRSGVPGRLSRQPHDLAKDALSLLPLPRLDHVSRAGELGVEVGGHRGCANVGKSGIRGRQEPNDQENGSHRVRSK